LWLWLLLVVETAMAVAQSFAYVSSTFVNQSSTLVGYEKSLQKCA